MALKNKCPYCFYKLAEDGFCARVCKMGALKRRQHELEEATKHEVENPTGSKTTQETTQTEQE